MKLILYLIGRLFVIGFALFIALLAGSLFIGFGFSTGMMERFLGPETHAELIGTDVGNLAIGIATFVVAVFAGFNLAGFTVVPVTIAVAITELMKWQSMITHLVLGGICALFTMFSVLTLPEGTMPANGTIIVSLAAGFVSAFFYWLIAGRNAGEWLSVLGEQNPDSEG